MATGANGRVFTNTAGKTINAELVGLNNKTAILKLDNGKQAKVPLSSLSKDDQLYVNTWWEKNKNMVSANDIRIAISKKSISQRASKDKDGKKKDSKSKTATTTYTCTLNSYTQKSIKDIKVDYTVYKSVSSRGEGGSSSSTEEISKTTAVALIEANKSAEFETEAVKCVTSSKKGKEGKGSSKRESIVGIVVTLSVDGKEFLKQSHPDNLLRRLEEEEERQSRKK